MIAEDFGKLKKAAKEILHEKPPAATSEAMKLQIMETFDELREEFENDESLARMYAEALAAHHDLRWKMEQKDWSTFQEVLSEK